MIIDPPSPFHPLSDWTLFRREMERQLAADPSNAELRQWRDKARAVEAEKRG